MHTQMLMLQIFNALRILAEELAQTGFIVNAPFNFEINKSYNNVA